VAVIAVAFACSTAMLGYPIANFLFRRFGLFAAIHGIIRAGTINRLESGLADFGCAFFLAGLGISRESGRAYALTMLRSLWNAGKH
jgi:hypothetical protein